MSGEIERATAQVKSDSGTVNMLQGVNMETPNSARRSEITFTEAGNANVRTSAGCSYMAAGPVSAACVVYQKARAANSLINRNLNLSVQDDRQAVVGE